MTNILLLKTPILIIIASICIISAVLCALLPPKKFISLFCAAIIGTCVALIIGFGGGLTDVFTALILSMLLYFAASYAKQKIIGGKENDI